MEEQDLLDRATGALRDEVVAPVSPDLIARTQSRVREAVDQPPVKIVAAADPRAPFRHPLFRAAAVFAIVACAVAAYVAWRQPSGLLVRQQPVQPGVPGGSPEMRDPRDRQQPVPIVAHGDTA